MLKNKNTKVKVLCLGIATLFTSLSAQAEPFAYVPDSDGKISIIDTVTKTEVANMPAFVGEIEAGYNGKTLYTAMWNRREVKVYDGTTYSLLSTIPLTRYPADIAVSLDTNMAYVATGESGLSGIVSVVDMATNIEVAAITVDPSPTFVAVNQDGSRAYTIHAGGTNITVIDTATNSVINNITLDAGAGYTSAKDLVATPNSHYMYAMTHGTTKYIHVIDTNTNTVINRYVAPMATNYLAITPDNSKLYAAVSSAWDFRIYTLAPLTGSPITNFYVGGSIKSIRMHPNGDALYVATAPVVGGYYVSQLEIVNAVTDTVSDVIASIGTTPYGRMSVGPLPEKVGGSASGLIQINVVCTNLTTSQQVTIPLLAGKSWDCENEGLVVNTGDQVDMHVTADVR